MQNEQLMTYVATERARGVTDDAIREALLAQGWRIEDVNSAMGVVATPTGSRILSFGNLFVGRLGRWPYFVTSVLLCVIVFAITVVALRIFGLVGVLVAWGVFFLILPLSISVAVRRLHDLNWSGWLVLLFLIPVINMFLGLILLFMPGTKIPNKHGPPQTSRNLKNTLLNL